MIYFLPPGDWVAFASSVSAIGLLCTLLFTSSNLVYGMAAIGHAPAALKRKHEKYNTPYVAIIMNGVLSALFMYMPFGALAEVDMFFYSLSTILKFMALLRLRSTMGDLPRPFKIPLSDANLKLASLPPILICVFTMLNCSFLTVVLGSAIMATSMVGYWIVIRPREEKNQPLFANS